ncbi:FAD-binding oxidoreductase [Chloroflexi bacterium TSY]|nr:FAD-binding oxidoreductase [Chloroflexi bacterium TSY]
MDYVIIGGGVYGCGVAWELASRGAEVLLLEAKTIASGASGGLGKRGVRANGRDLRELPLMHLSYGRWPELHEELGGKTSYERIGHLQLIERENERLAAPHVAWMQEQQGIPTQLLNGNELREREPHLSEDVIAALYCPNDGVADHTQTTLSFAQAAQKLGAEIHEQTRLTTIESNAGKVTAIITDSNERITVNQALILLCNSHVPHILQQHFDISLPVWLRLPQVMLTEPLDSVPLHHLLGHASRVLAMKAHNVDSSGRGQIMISGGWMGKWDEQTQSGHTQPDQITGNFEQAVALFPSLAGVQIAKADASRLETLSVDDIPIIDKLAAVDNLFYGVGWSGHGWAIAPALTRLLADWVWSGEQPDLLRPFAYRRFAKG